MESERRQSPRYPFLAAAELIESTSGARLKAATSDLGSMVEVVISREKAAIQSVEEEPNGGTGLRIEDEISQS